MLGLLFVEPHDRDQNRVATQKGDSGHHAAQHDSFDDIGQPVTMRVLRRAAVVSMTRMSTRDASPEPEPDGRRARLVDVAIDMFTRYGVKKTSIEDVARAAGIAKGSVYLEFRSKEDLFRAAAERVAQQLLDAAAVAADGEGPLLERVTAVLVAKFWRLYTLVHARPHAAELIGAKDAVAHDIFSRADDRYRKLLIKALRGAWPRRAKYHPTAIADILLRAAHGNAYGPGVLGAEAYRERLRIAVSLVLAGAGVIPPARPAR